MKKGAKVKFDKEGSGNFDFSCDYRDTPNEVMEAVNTQLKEHGLEVINHESYSDFYAFSIKKIKKVAAKKPKVHPLTTQTLKELGFALKMFGEYTFGDKGAHEVMDVESLAAKYRALPAKEAAAVLMEVYTSKEQKGYGNSLAGSIIGEMQDWDELFACPELDEIDW